jgi:hypothetical protein
MRATRKTEIEDFKRRINLTEYAAAHGYVLDRKASSRNSITMRGLAMTRSSWAAMTRRATGFIFRCAMIGIAAPSWTSCKTASA